MSNHRNKESISEVIMVILEGLAPFIGIALMTLAFYFGSIYGTPSAKVKTATNTQQCSHH